MTIKNLEERCIPMAKINPNFDNLANGAMTAIDHELVKISGGGYFNITENGKKSRLSFM